MSNTKSSVKKKSAKVDPIDKLIGMIDQYNSHIITNDLNDEKINIESLFDKNSPSYLEGKQDINEDTNYIQNQLYKLQKDKRYVPDYEDLDNPNGNNLTYHKRTVQKI